MKKKTPQEYGRLGGLKSNGGGQAFRDRSLARLAGKRSGEIRRQRAAERRAKLRAN